MHSPECQCCCLTQNSQTNKFYLLYFPGRLFISRTHSSECHCCCPTQNSQTCKFCLLHFSGRYYVWRTHSPECHCSCLTQNSQNCKFFSAAISSEVSKIHKLVSFFCCNFQGGILFQEHTPLSVSAVALLKIHKHVSFWLYFPGRSYIWRAHSPVCPLLLTACSIYLEPDLI
jgi:hypothetical protein